MKNTTNSRARLAIGALCLYFGVFPPINSETISRNNLANDETSTIIEKTNDAFDLAETKVFPDKPDDIPDDPVGPHPDADKCVCKGTGKITHGDGHQTDCPYHGKDVRPEPEPEPEPEPDIEPEKCTGCKCDTSNTYCNCIKAYGHCPCDKERRILLDDGFRRMDDSSGGNHYLGIR